MSLSGLDYINGSQSGVLGPTATTDYIVHLKTSILSLLAFRI